MNCANCGDAYAWDGGTAIVLNGDEVDFCSEGCKGDFMSENDLEEPGKIPLDTP
jgi:hypothetical protein